MVSDSLPEAQPPREDTVQRDHTEEVSSSINHESREGTEESYESSSRAVNRTQTEELEDGEEEEGERPEEQEVKNGEGAPPLPDEEVPDDGWAPVWDDNSQAYYFYNRFTGLSQWENPRVPDAQSGANNQGAHNDGITGKLPRSQVAGGYDPAIHGDYDPTAPYAQAASAAQEDDPSAAYPASSADSNYIYTAAGTFNRFTGKWQSAALAPENFNDESKSRRQMNAYFDVDAAANSHDGKSLKAERSGKKLTKKELKAFKDKRRERKEEKRRAWLRD